MKKHRVYKFDGESFPVTHKWRAETEDVPWWPCQFKSWKEAMEWVGLTPEQRKAQLDEDFNRDGGW